MKHYYLIFILFLLYLFASCSKPPLERNKEIDNEFDMLAEGLKIFAKKNNNGKRRTRDPGIIKDFFEEAQGIIDFAEENSSEYSENLKKLTKDGKVRLSKIRPKKYLNSKKVSYQYSRRNLKKQLEMVLKNLGSSKKYKFNLSLTLSRIFKDRPRTGRKSSGSKKYESIRKKFN